MTMEMTRPGDFSLLAVSGPDARRFLQGQLSCNMDDLSGQHSLPGAYCNLKGRVVADFMVIDSGDALLLRCAPGMAGILAERLEKYAVFFKVRMEDVSSGWQRGGLIGEAALGQITTATGAAPPQANWETVHAGGMIIVRIPGGQPRLEWLARQDAPLPEHRVVGNEQDWQLEDIRSGILHVDTTRCERFTPQVLNYDLDGSINFRKGCYTGQEIVARMHYRGKADRRLYHLVTDGPIDTDELSGIRITEVLQQLGVAAGAEMLAILPGAMAGLTPGTLRFTTADGDAAGITVNRIHGFEGIQDS